MRLIDADALEMALKVPMMTINGSPYIDYGFVVNSIIAAPAIEQPEIIRCQDCKHYKRYEYTGDFACHYVIGGTVRREPDDFCSRAERRKVSE